MASGQTLMSGTRKSTSYIPIDVHHKAEGCIPLAERLAELVGKPEATVTFDANTSFEDVLQKMDKLGSDRLCFPVASRPEAVLERCEKKVAINFMVRSRSSFI